jgi:hypothetical protein
LGKDAVHRNNDTRWRFNGRRRVRQRSSRVDVLILLAVANFHRVRHRSNRVAVASLKLLGAAAAIYFSRFRVSFRLFYLLYRKSKRADGFV